MQTLTFSVRMDPILKKNFELLCDEFGMNMSVAINIFAKAMVRERKIPFEIKSYDYEVNSENLSYVLDHIRNTTSELSLTEINEEIKQVREELKLNG